jgi:hypothetical protein
MAEASCLTPYGGLTHGSTSEFGMACSLGVRARTNAIFNPKGSPQGVRNGMFPGVRATDKANLN